MTTNGELTMGSRFQSFSELKDAINTYEKQNCVQLYLRDSRKLEAAKKRVPKIAASAKESLQYYSLMYACVFGGKKHKSMGEGKRRRNSTIKQGCKAKIKISLSTDCQSLVVSEINETHNHDIVEDILPRQKRLNPEEKEDPENLLMLRANKKIFKLHMEKVTGKKAKLTTPDAFEQIKKKIDMSTKITEEPTKYQSTETNCTCSFFLSEALPCRHILAVRRMKGFALFAELVTDRWMASYMQVAQNLKKVVSGESSLEVTNVATKTATKILSQHQKQNGALKLAQELAELASEFRMNEYNSKILEMENLKVKWLSELSFSSRELSTSPPETVDQTEELSIKTPQEPHLQKNVCEIETKFNTQLASATIQVQTQESTAHFERSAYPADIQKKESMVQADLHSSCQPLLEVLTLPSRIKKRGRPKGAENTIIGIPAKRKNSRL